jgi:hypothetical protein
LSFRSASKSAFGILAKASSVGAKTVKGPFPLSVSTRPAAPKAVAKVLNEPAPTAVSTMSAAWADNVIPNARILAIKAFFIMNSVR